MSYEITYLYGISSLTEKVREAPLIVIVAEPNKSLVTSSQSLEGALPAVGVAASGLPVRKIRKVVFVPLVVALR